MLVQSNKHFSAHCICDIIMLSKILFNSDVSHRTLPILEFWIDDPNLFRSISILLGISHQIKIEVYCCKDMPMEKLVNIPFNTNNNNNNNNNNKNHDHHVTRQKWYVLVDFEIIL